jgi:hypothetical protein
MSPPQEDHSAPIVDIADIADIARFLKIAISADLERVILEHIRLEILKDQHLVH